jgi:hypothetical protein
MIKYRSGHHTNRAGNGGSCPAKESVMRASMVVRAAVFPVIAAAVLLGQTSAPPPPKPPQEQLPPPVRYPWDTDQDWAVRQKLAQRVPKISFDAATFEEVLGRLGDIAGVTMRANWAALEACAMEKDAEVTLKARDARVGDVLVQALEAVSAGEVNLTYEIHNGTVVVSTVEELSRKTTTVKYDCADLVRAEEDDLAKYIHRVCEEIGRQRGREVWNDAAQSERLISQVIQDSHQQFEKQLSELISATIDPESWRGSGGNIGSIAWFGPQLVITQTQRAHAQIFDLLTKLREQRDRQPAKARWP